MKKGIILTSFGTTYEETRKKTIEPLENEVAEKHKDHLVLRAFTSRIVARRLKDRGYPVDNPSEALAKMKEENIRHIYVQPSLIIEGHEYDKTKKEIDEFLSKNEGFSVSLGQPLLAEDIDYERVVDGLAIENKSDQALVYMGHGSDHIADRAYEKLEGVFRQKGYDNVYVATVEGSITLEDVIKKLEDSQIKSVELRPFMLVAGDHAINDMASDEDDSWKSVLEEKGYSVTSTLKGLGEFKEIRDIFIDHLEEMF